MTSERKYKYDLTSVVGAALALATVQTAAAETDATDLEAVTVYARRLVPLSRVAAAVSVIPQETIERTLSADVKELVRYEPGLSVRSDPFRFGVDTFAVRGVGGNRVSVEVDGIPAAGGFAIGAYSDSGRRFVDLTFVERVEVLRGPASSTATRMQRPASNRAMRRKTTAGTLPSSAPHDWARPRRCLAMFVARGRHPAPRPTSRRIPGITARTACLGASFCRERRAGR